MIISFNRHKKTILKAMGEVLLIIIAILGAFAIEDWQQSKTQKKLLTDTLNITMTELNNNHCALIKGHQHQTRVREILKTQLPTAKTKAAQEQLYLSIYGIGIWQPATLMSTAWDTAIATGAVRHIPLKDATLITQFYNDADNYSERINDVVTEMIKNDYKDIELIQLLSGIAGSNDSLWWFEKRQLQRYEKHFPALVKKYNFKVNKCPTTNQ